MPSSNPRPPRDVAESDDEPDDEWPGDWEPAVPSGSADD